MLLRNWKKSILATTSLILMSFVLSGCSNDELIKAEKSLRLDIESTQTDARNSIKALDESLAQKRILNANLISKYSDILLKSKPDLAPIIEEIRKEATNQGPTFTGITSRLSANDSEFKKVVSSLANSDVTDEQYKNAIGKYQRVIAPEYDKIIGASLPNIYNEALGDYVNMLADMSKDQLPRVDGKKSSDFYKETGAANVGPATMLVGNDNYGQWKQDSSGNSFWEFYGQYRLLSDLLQIGVGQPYYYSRWNSHRPYSHYNDYHANRYGSQSVISRNAKLSSAYKLPSNSSITPSQKYIQKTPSVSKQFAKMDNQFSAKRPNALVASRPSASTNAVSPKAPKNSAFQYTKPSQQGSKSTRSSSSSRSSGSGK